MTSLLPHNPEAEDGVIGSVLIDPQAYAKVKPLLSAESFYDDRNNFIFRACQHLSESGRAIDQITVSTELAAMGRLAEAGGPARLSHFVATMPTSVHAVYYAGIVRECWQRRRLIELAAKLAERAHSEDTVDGVIADTLSGLLQAKQVQAIGGPMSFETIAHAYTGEFTDWLEGKRGLRGLSTGFPDLDRSTDGLEAGKLYLVAGRPAMGKTMILIRLGQHLAMQGNGVLMFSLEQNMRAIWERAVLGEANVDRYSVRRDGANETIKGLCWDAYGKLQGLPIWVDDMAAITTGESASRLMALGIEHKIGAMIFDYIDLSGDEAKSEELRIAGIAKKLRDIAKTVGIPVIAACQLNREVEKRGDKRPQLSDLRYSGSLEQVADIVMFLYRDEYYSDRGMKDKDESLKHTLELIIAKNKDGPVGHIFLYYDASTGAIRSMEKRG